MVLFRLRVRRRAVLVALLFSAMLTPTLIGITPHSAAADPITSVKGSACGYWVRVGLFGGPQDLRGCGEGAAGTAPSYSPMVTLPAGGSPTAITADDYDGAAGIYGPATIFGGRWPEDVESAPPSGPIHTLTYGPPGEGTVYSSTEIALYQTPNPVQCYGDSPGTQNCNAPGGFGPFPVEGDRLFVDCTASAEGVSGSTEFQNATLATATDFEGAPLLEATEEVPAIPPVNYTRHGVITNVGDVFTVVYNEQIHHSDGSLTVNAVHMYLFGPTAIGEVVKGSVTCGVNPSAATGTDTVPPHCGTPVVKPKNVSDQAPMVPRTELVGVVDPGKGEAGTGLQSITNIQSTNATVTIGEVARSPVEAYREFAPGQTGPLAVTAKRLDESLPMSWSFDATDAAGNVATCTGVPYIGPNTVSVGDVSVAEGAPGTTIATFPVTRSGETFPARVKYKTSLGTPGGDCSSGADYVGKPLTTLDFAVGEASKAVYVLVCGDTIPEANDTFSLLLSEPTALSIADASGTATIVNDDAPPTLTVDDPSVIEGAAGATSPLTFTVTRSGGTIGTSTVKHRTSLGNATAESDYGSVALDTLTFAPGETVKEVTVNVLGDGADEANETFSLVLTAPVGARLSDSAGTATIVDDDPPGGTVTPAPATFLSIADISLDEVSEATFTILRTGETEGTSTATYRTTGGNAVAGIDYTAIAATPVIFAAGETSKAVTVDVLDDNLVEANETFNLALSLPSKGTSIADGAGTATLANDDGATYLAVNDLAFPEGNSGLTPFTFTVSRSGNTNGVSSVAYKTGGGNAGTVTDYTAIASGSLSFAAGEVTKEVTVNVAGDEIREPSETFNLVLTAPTGATISDAAGTATILNDEPPPVISVDSISVTEGNSGKAPATPAVFTFTRTGNTTSTSTVKYKTIGDTAGAPADFTAVPSTTLTFAANEVSKTVTVSVVGDVKVEPDEQFILELSEPTGATIPKTYTDTAFRATATIVNDD